MKPAAFPARARSFAIVGGMTDSPTGRELPAVGPERLGAAVRAALAEQGTQRLRMGAAETVKPEEFYRRIPAMVLEEQVDVDELSSPDDNLEAVFEYLVK